LSAQVLKVREKKAQKASSKIAFPLDGSPDQALDWARQLRDLVGCLKIGLELYVKAGPSVIESLRAVAPEPKLFLDLKLHDIPATVAKAAEAAAALGADFLTAHALAGPEALTAAVQAAGPKTKILAVTVLTSQNPLDFEELAPDYQLPGRWALLLAERALKAGCQGLVASPREVKALRENFGSAPFLVVPGIRPVGASIPDDDQKRVGTPKQALEDGADLLVVGRPLRLAPDIQVAARALALEMI
jgi:orotidine-5'-phosphate decarboxylase